MADDDVTPGEMHRSILRMENELREMKSGYVPRGEYEENRRAQGERIGSIEKDVSKFEGAWSAVNRTAWTGVVLPVVVLLLGAAVLAAFGLK